MKHVEKSLSEALRQASADNEDLRRLVCGLYSTGSFRSGNALSWVGQASRIWIAHPHLRPKAPTIPISNNNHQNEKH